jgi:hypothetical protein
VTGQDSGLFRDQDPVLAANRLIGMIDGLALQVLLGSESMTIERMREACEHTIRDLEIAAV